MVERLDRADSKYHKTAVKMVNAFLELLETKDFEFIMVKEICKRAEVNRSTFYLHYETVGDLLNESTEYMSAQLLKYFPNQSKDFIDSIKNAELKDLYLITPGYLNPYFTFILENKKLFKTALAKSDVLRLTELYKKMFTRVLDPIMDRFNVPKNKRKYILAYFISGIMAVINEWLRKDCAEPIDFIAGIISELVCKTRSNDK